MTIGSTNRMITVAFWSTGRIICWLTLTVPPAAHHRHLHALLDEERAASAMKNQPKSSANRPITM